MAAKRKRLHKVKITELSSVDDPAQEGAVDVLLKRAPDTPDDLTVEGAIEFAKNDLGMTDPRLLSVADGHQHLLDAGAGQSGRTTWEYSANAEMGHDHGWLRLADGTIQIVMSEGHTHDSLPPLGLEPVEARAPVGTVVNIQAPTPSAGEPGGTSSPEIPMTKTAEEIAAEGKATEDRIAGLEKRAERAEKIGELSDAQKAHFTGLEESKQDAFLAKSADDREAEVVAIAKALEGDDPVEYTSSRTGEVFRKSVGSAVIGLAKRSDVAEAKSERLEKQLDEERLEKRATAELPNLPGDAEVKVAVLRAVEGIENEAVRKGADELLKAANANKAGAFKTDGTAEAPVYITPQGGNEAQAQLEKKAQEHIKANPGTLHCDAYDLVSKAEPELLEKALAG